MRKLVATAFGLWVLASGAAFAVKPDEMLKDPALEARARTLSAELRCVVCEGQSIDDSDAEIARDIRILVREHLKAGEDENTIRKYLTDRYGSYILLRPPLAPQTALLWITPALALLLGAGGIVYAIRRNARTRRQAAPLGTAEAARLDALMARKD